MNLQHSAPAPDEPGPETRRPVRLVHLLVGFTVGGAEKLVLDLAAGADPARFDITVASLKGAGPMLSAFREAGITTKTFGGLGKWDLSVMPRLVAFLRRRRTQVLHCHTFRANVAGRLAGKAAALRAVVASVHGSDHWMGGRHRLVERLTAPMSHAMTACSEDSRLFAAGQAGLPPQRISVVYNGIRPDRFRSLPSPAESRQAFSLPPDGWLVGFVGRLVEPVKGLAVLARAAGRVTARNPRVFFVVAGDGPDRGLLEDAVRTRGLGGRFFFLGEVEQVPRLLAGLDMLVLPSLEEGFGIAAAEAMAAGLPVAASRAGGIPELVVDGECGRLVPPGDDEALADVVDAMASDPGAAREMGRAGRRHVLERFTIDRTRRSFERIYAGLLGLGG